MDLNLKFLNFGAKKTVEIVTPDTNNNPEPTMLPNEHPIEKNVEINNDFNEQKLQEVTDKSNPKNETTTDSTPPKLLDDNSIVEENSSVDTSKSEILAHSQAIEEKIELLLTKVEALKDDLCQRNEYDKFKDEAIQRMSKQIETHELGLMRKIKESLLKDIISFYDTVDSFQSRFDRNNDKVKLDKDIQLLKEEIEEILFRNDVIKIELPENKFYDREIQMVVKKEITSFESENNEIVKLFRQGFQIEGKILRKQEVIIKEYKPTSTNH